MSDFESDVSAAGLFLAGVATLYALLCVVAPPTSAHMQAADPLVQLLNAMGGLWIIPLASIVPAVAWWARHPPGAAALRHATRRALLACAVVAVGLSALRGALGPSLPSFVPPEESARPGVALGIGAALIEEGLFRLGLLAPLYTAARRASRSRLSSAGGTVAVTALALAAAHEIGPGAGPFDGAYFATRILVLGLAMGALFIRPGPSFLVPLHCAAHVAIPLLFPGTTPTR